MKRFVFRLSSVLRVRRVEEDLARGALARAHARAQEAQAAREAADARLTGRPGLAPVVPLAAYRSWRAMGDLQAASWQAAAKRAEQAAAQLTERRGAWQVAAQRVAALERLEARRREAWRRELERAEARDVDDLVQARYQGDGAWGADPDRGSPA
jgi:flagellar FliJ protein